MRKRIVIISIVLFAFCLTGCGKNSNQVLTENMKKIELTGNLVTYQAYYHNVVEYKKEAGSGITHLFEEDRKLFAEYTGTIRYGIDLTKVKIEVKGNEITVFIPKAKIIGEANVDKDDFDAKNFIESREGINKNPITADDSAGAFDEAQKNMKEEASKNEEVLSIAQKRAKVVIEENINQLSGLSKKDYSINWEYEQ